LSTVNPRRQEEVRDHPPAYEQLLKANAAAKLKRVKSVGRAIRLHPRIRHQINQQLAADAQALPRWKLAASHYVDAGLHLLTTVDLESEEVLGQLLTAAFEFEEQTFGDDQGESTRFTLRPDTNAAIDKVKYALIANGQDGMLNHVCSVMVWQYLLSLRDTSGAG